MEGSAVDGLIVVNSLKVRTIQVSVRLYRYLTHYDEVSVLHKLKKPICDNRYGEG